MLVSRIKKFINKNNWLFLEIKKLYYLIIDIIKNNLLIFFIVVVIVLLIFFVLNFKSIYISLLSIFNFLLQKLLAKSREEDQKSRQAEQVKEDIEHNYRRHWELAQKAKEEARKAKEEARKAKEERDKAYSEWLYKELLMHKKREKKDSKNTKEYMCANEWAAELRAKKEEARLKKAQLENDEKISKK